MNYKMVLSILGRAMLIEAVLLLFPMLVGVIYAENTYMSFLVPIVGLIAIGLPFSLLKIKDKSIYAKEGFVIVALSWIILSLVGAVPFVISGAIPNYVDALFETVSGFTTTGASVVSDVESLPNSLLFWRSFTHFVGGMGILVFVLAILPKYDSGVMHVFRAESPGPSVGKLVSKLTFTARILYAIYIGMTVIMIVFLACGKMPIFDSVLHAFSTAGTGGFGTKNNSIAYYDSAYLEMVIAVFMLLFSINFNVFYLILIGNFKKALKCEELRAYLIIIVVATITIALNILSSCISFADALRYSFFQVTSISSTTGFSSADFDKWPALSKAVIIVLMIIGACGGSTGGGIKVSRLVILVKSAFADVKRLIHPRAVVSVKFEGQLLDKETERNVHTYFILWILIVALCTVLLCIDVNDFMTNFSATLSCIGNIGPGFNLVGPTLNFGLYTSYSKILLSVVMLFGRLEIFPMLILFAPRTWKKG
ncbi:MAG: TrkH family potassium uptake protein [Clostridia bacterium]|nr:TrkH family potassium uptake protein [Clostridia bacterium]